MRSFILILTWAALAAAETLHLLDTGDKIRSAYSKDVSLTLRPDGFLALEYGKGMSYPGEAIHVSEDDAYAELSESGTFDVVDEETRDLMASMGEGGTPPFRLTVDFDRRARIRDAEGEVSWVFPDKPRVGVESIDSGGMNFLRSGDTMVGSGSDYYLELRGSFLVVRRHSDDDFELNINRPALSKRGEMDTILTVTESGMLTLRGSDGGNLWASGKSQDPDEGPFTLGISSDAILRVTSNEDNMVWGMDLKTGQMLKMDLPTEPVRTFTHMEKEVIRRKLEIAVLQRDSRVAELQKKMERLRRMRAANNILAKGKILKLQREQEELVNEIEMNRSLTNTLVGVLNGVGKVGTVVSDAMLRHIPFGEVVRNAIIKPDITKTPEYISMQQKLNRVEAEAGTRQTELDRIAQEHQTASETARQSHEAQKQDDERQFGAQRQADETAWNNRMEAANKQRTNAFIEKFKPPPFAISDVKGSSQQCEKITTMYNVQPFESTTEFEKITNIRDRNFYKSADCACTVVAAKYQIVGWTMNSHTPPMVSRGWNENQCACKAAIAEFGVFTGTLGQATNEEGRRRREHYSNNFQEKCKDFY